MIKNTNFVNLADVSNNFETAKNLIDMNIEKTTDDKTRYILKMQRWILGNYATFFNELDKNLVENDFLTYEDILSHFDLLKTSLKKNEKRLQIKNIYFAEKVLPVNPFKAYSCSKCGKTCTVELNNGYNCEIRKIEVWCLECKRRMKNE